MAATPRVSVCIASYQHARYLPDCLDSILNQTYRDFEIVVVDDGSTDGSHAILLDYQARFPDRVIYARHPGATNRGYTATSNECLRWASGELVAWIGSDDLWTPDKLERQVALLDAHPELGMVYSYASFIDSEGRKIDGLYGVDITRGRNPVGRMIWSCHPPAMTVLVRRSCLDRTGWFDESLVYADWDLMIRVFARCRVGFLNASLAKYRQHSHNLSKGVDPQIDLHRIVGVLQSVRTKARQVGGSLAEPRNLAQIEMHLAFLQFCRRSLSKAVDNIDQAFVEDPSLSGDIERLDEWLNQWKPAFYTPGHPHFGFWAIDSLPKTVPQHIRRELVERQLAERSTLAFYISRGMLWAADPQQRDRLFYDLPGAVQASRFKSHVLREVYGALLFQSYARGDLSLAKRFWVQAVRRNPRWLGNRGVWSICLRSLFARG